MTLKEILEKIQSIQDQLREDNTAGALDDLNKLEDDLTIAVEKPQPMTADEEDKNAGITRLADGSIKSEKTTAVEERNNFGFPTDARDHHFVKKNPKRLIG
tara:strand:- start:406 stop:708 length:303 start_codon:yes stop_codon:yes gene_type:complete